MFHDILRENYVATEIHYQHISQFAREAAEEGGEEEGNRMRINITMWRVEYLHLISVAISGYNLVPV